MNTDLLRLLESSGGVVTRSQLTAAVPRHVADHALTSGVILRVFPRTFIQPDRATEPAVLQLAALRYAGGDAALSHLTGLGVWGVMVPAGARSAIHMVTGSSRHLRGTSELIVHRRAGFSPDPPFAVVRNGLAVVRLERCLVDSWPCQPPHERRAPVILAVQTRATTPQRVGDAVREVSNLPDLIGLVGLVELLSDGCMSELEIWGYLHVFNHPSLPPARRQAPVSLGQRTVHLDLAYDEEMVAVELDGATYHGPQLRRELDLRRDAAVATRGWLTVRFSHARLHAEPEAVRRDLRATLEVRRHQLRSG